ncbi:MAG: UPF0262 family protein [Alphaproteobacteria bacterium]|nr:UPF0262 family protein [Alphaproteobacteria bacterium]
MTGNTQRIAKIALDERGLVRRSAQVEHERKVAIYDLIEENSFAVLGHDGPYDVRLSVEENRLMFDVRAEAGTELIRFALPLAPFKTIVRDYFTICESYYSAIKSATPSKIEAIDMGRRGLHNEGAALLRERLAEKADFDDGTARRLFTLLCVLHIRA